MKMESAVKASASAFGPAMKMASKPPAHHLLQPDFPSLNSRARQPRRRIASPRPRATQSTGTRMPTPPASLIRSFHNLEEIHCVSESRTPIRLYICLEYDGL